jgi:hypothetical protein
MMSSTGSVRPEHTSLPMRDHDNLVKDKYAAQYELRKVRPHVETEPGVAKASQNTCQLAEAGRGWPRLEAALSLAWRWRGVCAGGRSGRRLWAAVLVPGAAARLRGA